MLWNRNRQRRWIGRRWIQIIVRQRWSRHRSRVRHGRFGIGYGGLGFATLTLDTVQQATQLNEFITSWACCVHVLVGKGPRKCTLTPLFTQFDSLRKAALITISFQATRAVDLFWWRILVPTSACISRRYILLTPSGISETSTMEIREIRRQ